MTLDEQSLCVVPVSDFVKTQVLGANHPTLDTDILTEFSPKTVCRDRLNSTPPEPHLDPPAEACQWMSAAVAGTRPKAGSTTLWVVALTTTVPLVKRRTMRPLGWV